MQAVIARVEMSPEAAELASRVLTSFSQEIEQRLTGIVPVHTKAALEKQLATGQEAARALERGALNPVEVDVPDPAEA